jgi:lipoyl(octanoyl) transferase
MPVIPSEVEESADIVERTRDPSTSLEMTRKLLGKLKVYDDMSRYSAASNMAIDEALLEYATAPSIRFYRWQSPALSFGYFGKFNDVADYAAGHDLIRRWTGGGIVVHGNDLTYALVIPADDSAFNESSLCIYEKIHRALADALNAIGQCAVVARDVEPGRSNIAQGAAVNASGYNCFANPVRSDVMIDGRKIAGAAQRRTRRGLLQQGSIQGVELKNKFTERFADALSANRTEHDISEEILIRARELAEQKYATDCWLRKR